MGVLSLFTRNTASAMRQNARKLPTITQIRNLNLHEYQSKILMTNYGIPTQAFRTVDKLEDAKKMAIDLGDFEYVVKAQIHAGGRGRGHFDNGYKGGVQLVKTPQEVEDVCQKMLGARLITKQTGPEGVEVKTIMVAEQLEITKETYVAILMDRAANGPVFVVSPEGGMDIEEVAHNTPEKLLKEPVDIRKGVQQEQVDRLTKFLGFTGEAAKEAGEVMIKLYNLFIDIDSTQIEINPFGMDGHNKIYCFDAKFNFDDAAEFRQKDIFAQRDLAEEDMREMEADKFGLSFVGMDGNIGCMVNGAGLAMATMDVIKLHGGEPANFLDLGGGVSQEAVSEAFKILTGDSQVKALFVNIFGGIVDCAMVARGIIAAARDLKLEIPITVRLRGNNESAARRLIAQSGMQVTMIEDMDDAARHAVASI